MAFIPYSDFCYQVLDCCFSQSGTKVLLFAHICVQKLTKSVYFWGKIIDSTKQADSEEVCPTPRAGVRIASGRNRRKTKSPYERA